VRCGCPVHGCCNSGRNVATSSTAQCLIRSMTRSSSSCETRVDPV
jgi:hypothetical protein